MHIKQDMHIKSLLKLLNYVLTFKWTLTTQEPLRKVVSI